EARARGGGGHPHSGPRPRRCKRDRLDVRFDRWIRLDQRGVQDMMGNGAIRAVQDVMGSGPSVVAKYGGSVMEGGELADAWARDVVALARTGARPLVVHGGGPALTRTMARLGIDSRF